MIVEIWKDVKGHESSYQISNLGRVKSLSRKVSIFNGYSRTLKERILIPQKQNTGYLSVNLCGKLYSIHRLVAIAFIPNPNNYPVINHINNNKHDNRVENLEWCTSSYNAKYRFITGSVPIIGNRVVTNTDILDIRTKFSYMKTKDLMVKYGMCRKAIYNIRKFKTFKTVLPEL